MENKFQNGYFTCFCNIYTHQQSKFNLKCIYVMYKCFFWFFLVDRQWWRSHLMAFAFQLYTMLLLFGNIFYWSWNANACFNWEPTTIHEPMPTPTSNHRDGLQSVKNQRNNKYRLRFENSLKWKNRWNAHTEALLIETCSIFLPPSSLSLWLQIENAQQQ